MTFIDDDYHEMVWQRSIDDNRLIYTTWRLGFNAHDLPVFLVNPNWPGIVITDKPLPGLIPGSEIWE